MNGLEAYRNQYEGRIGSILERKPELKGFYAFISDKSDSTAYVYLNHVANFLDEANKRPTDLTLDDFSTYMLGLRRTKKGEITTQQYKINGYHALKKYGKYLVAIHVLKENPMDFIDRPTSKEMQKTIEKRENGYLTPKEIKKLLTTIMNSKKSDFERTRDLAIVAVLLNTGIRCSALYKLDYDNIDFRKRELIVTDKESEINIHRLSETTMEYLEAYCSERDYYLDELRDIPELFISNRKKRITQNSINAIIKKYSEIAFEGKKTISAHKLRATYGTQLYNETHDIYFVQDCMKHKSPTTTERYIRGNKNRTAEAADIMGSMLDI